MLGMGTGILAIFGAALAVLLAGIGLPSVWEEWGRRLPALFQKIRISSVPS